MEARAGRDQRRLIVVREIAHKLPMTKGSAVMPGQSCVEVPTLRPSRPLDGGIVVEGDFVAAEGEAANIGPVAEIVASGSMKAPPWKLPKR